VSECRECALSRLFHSGSARLGFWHGFRRAGSGQAGTGRVDSLSAGFAAFAAETDPATIPRAPQPSGRSALVPGFVAGIGAAHRRFGRLPWSDLFSPAIWVAEITIAGIEPRHVVLYFDGGVYVLGDAFQVADLAAQVGRRTGARIFMTDGTVRPREPSR
jgi:acetyl esterase/lipase